MKKRLSLLALPLLLAACETGPNSGSTSGADYLKKYDNLSTTQSKEGHVSIDQKIREAAAVEPILKFPARIGLARIDQGSMTHIPLEEGRAWLEAAQKLGPEFGEFIALSPLVAEMAANSAEIWKYNDGGNRSISTVNKIRFGAARQHVDAILLYEVFSNVDKSNNLLKAGNLTIIGGFLLPSTSIAGEGYADALLIDTLQGYPYGTTQAIVHDKAYASSWGWGSGYSDVINEVKTRAGIQIAEKSVALLTKIRDDSAKRSPAKTKNATKAEPAQNPAPVKRAP